MGGSVGSGGGCEPSGGGGPGWNTGGVGVAVAGGGGVTVDSGVADGGSGVPGAGVMDGGNGGGVPPAPVPPPLHPCEGRTVGTGVAPAAPRNCASVSRSRVGVTEAAPGVTAVAVVVTSAVALGVVPAVWLVFGVASALTCGTSAVGTAGAASPLPAPPQYANAPAPNAQPTSAITDRFMT